MNKPIHNHNNRNLYPLLIIAFLVVQSGRISLYITYIFTVIEFLEVYVLLLRSETYNVVNDFPKSLKSLSSYHLISLF